METAKIDKNRYSAGKSWNLQNLRGSVNSAISAASAESRIPMGTEFNDTEVLSVQYRRLTARTPKTFRNKYRLNNMATGSSY